MRKLFGLSLLLFIVFAIENQAAYGQIIQGVLKERNTDLLAADVKITQLKTGKVTYSDSLGKFKINLSDGNKIYLGGSEFAKDSFTLKPENNNIVLYIDPIIKDMGTVRISHSKLKEKIRESPVTVESMGPKAIKETPASDFYEGLGHLRGVDITAASMGFRIINTRGFNSTSPVRSLQLIDGMDNQAPGLNFSLGNFLGCSELDVYTADIIVGASSAYYGPNAFNGVINMTTKSPWQFKGLSAQVKIGERELGQIMIRWADVIKNKNGIEKFAYKINLCYMRAFDWQANNDAPTSDSKVGKLNLGGYDAVNRYGDENLLPGTNATPDKQAYYEIPGMGIVHKTGYWEKDLVNYNTRNLKTNFLAAYKINKNNEIQYQINFGTGSTVYQGDNRYSLRNILFTQNRLEWKHKEDFVRMYVTHEDAGNTYDAVYTAVLLQAAAKKEDDWYSDYRNYWQNNISPRVQSLPGYPQNPFASNYVQEVDRYLQLYADKIAQWHGETRNKANQGVDYAGLPRIYQMYNRFIPGTPRFDSFFKQITSRKSFGEGGSGFFDRSAMYHAVGEKNYKIKTWNCKTGANVRLYAPYSKGTIFKDTGNARFTNFEMGFYAGTEKRFFKNRWKFNGTMRLDKNQNFNWLFSPAISFIYSKKRKNTYRISLNSAIRNPTLQDQYLHYNVGRAILLGNLSGFNNAVSLSDVLKFSSTQNRKDLRYFTIAAVKPEKVKTFEIGYKGLVLKNRLSIDAGYYISNYTDFIGYQIAAEVDVDTSINRITRIQAYRIATNSKKSVLTQGLSAGFFYFFGDVFAASCNWSWNQLRKGDDSNPLIPAFNTPAHKVNIGLGSSSIDKKINLGSKSFSLKNWGFQTNWKWVKGFLFEGSPQFTGFVKSYNMFDVQISRSIKKWNSVLKMGASNLLNTPIYQVYGGPAIGRMAYLSFTIEP